MSFVPISIDKYVKIANKYRIGISDEKQIVEIIKKKDAHPSSKWLEYAKTTIARKHIKSYLEKITNPLKFQSFTIDCRDSKETNIGAQVRISLDGSIMYIDSIKRSNTEKDYYRYIAPRNEVYINKAINIIIEYLKENKYNFHDLRLYDLKDDTENIVKKETDK